MGYHILALPNQVLLINSVLTNEVYVCLYICMYVCMYIYMYVCTVYAVCVYANLAYCRHVMVNLSSD